MRRFRWFLFFLFFGSIFIAAFQAQPPAKAKTIDVSGIWEMTVDTPQGSMPPTDVTFEQQGEVLKVSMKSPRGDDMKGEGKIKAEAIEWTVAISTPQGDFAILFKGKIEGETMSGQAEMGDFGSMGWKATKKK
jgi:hypothetical protein